MYRNSILLIGFVLVLSVVIGTTPVSSAPIITSVVKTGSANPAPVIAVPFQDQAECFVDRTHVYTALPTEIPKLVGAEYIMTANDDKGNDTLNHAVTISMSASIYLILDNRLGASGGGQGVDPDLSGMPWVATMGFVDTGYDIGVDESADGDIDQWSSLFLADFSAGIVNLPGQTAGHGGNMYGIVVTSPQIPPCEARSPDPAHLAVDVPIDTNLGWVRGAGANQEEVYFGTDPCALPKVTDIMVLPPFPPLYDPPVDLIASTTYYWQIVEVNGVDRCESAIWEFTTVRGEAQPEYPYDGAIIVGDMAGANIWTKLIFVPGPTAVEHKGYFNEDYSKVDSRAPDANLGAPPYAETPTWEYTYFAGNPSVLPATQTLVRGTKYYWTVDEKDALGNTFAGGIWEFAIQGFKAFEPSPPNEAIFISDTPFLSWLPGFGVIDHDIYMGTSWEDVNNAVYHPTIPPPEFVITRPDPNYQVVSSLPGETKIYWRVDQVNSRMPPPLGGGTYYKGDVWCFSTLPSFPITDPNLIVWWKFDMGFETIAFDWSGHEHHGVISGATWTVPGGGGSGNCLDFGGDGDMVEDADGGDYINGLSAITMAMWIKSDVVGTNSGFIILEDPDGGDARNIRYDSAGSNAGGTNLLKYGVEYTGGDEQDESSSNLQTTDWQHIAVTSASGAGLKLYINGVLDIPAGDDPPVTGTITGCTTLIVGKGCKDEGPGDGWDGLIDDVQIYDYALSAEQIRNLAAPPAAWIPSPYDGETGVVSPVTLRWNPGKYAAKHEVYFSTDKALVDSRSTAAYLGQRDPNNYGPIALETGKIYYWAIDEVNVAGPEPYEWAGDTWIFRAEGAAGGLLGLYYHWDGILPPALPDYEPGPANPFQIFVLSRIDPSVDFNWGNGSPDPNINADNFASRWVGHLECPVDANYTFYVNTDDGGRLFIDGQELILLQADGTEGSWRQQGMGAVGLWRASIVLSAGMHDIEMHQYELGGGAGAQLRWSADPVNPADDAISMQIIPPIWLWPPLFASGPNPPHLSTVDDKTPALEWIPGLYAAYHELYFSANFDDVNNRNPAIKETVIDPCRPYPAVPRLKLATTYYWLVDEVKSPSERWDARTVWEFTISECLSLDNMEDYNDRGELRQVWRDGNADVVWGGVHPYLYLVQGGSNGSNLNVSTAVGSPFGGATGPIPPTPLNDEAMVLYYDNDGWTYQALPGEEKWIYDTPFYSEIEANTIGDNSLGVGQTWDSEGVKSLSLLFQGHPISDGYYDATLWPAYTINGRGRDIQGRHDEFYFLSQYPFVGNGSIQAQVYSVENTNNWAKAGVMIREKWTPYSRYAAVFITPGQGITFQYRVNEDGPTTTITKPGVSAPQYVKLVRNIDSTFEAKHSDTGFAWEDVNAPGSAPVFPAITMGTIEDPNLYAGSAVSSHNANQICAADFNNVLISPLPPNWIYGNIGTNDPEQLYVALSDGVNTSVVEHSDVNAATLTTWQEWNIELSDFTTVNLDGIKKVYIGFGDRSAPVQGGSGALYVDDIRACPPRCVPAFAQMTGDIAQPYDCTVDEKDISVLAGDWLLEDGFITSVAPGTPGAHYELENNTNDSVSVYHGTAYGGPVYVAGKIGTYAMDLDGTDDYVKVLGDHPGIEFYSGSFSISLWMKSNYVADSPKEFIINNGTNGSEFDGASGNRYVIKLQDTNLRFLVDDDTTKPTLDGPSSKFATGEWVHVVAVRDDDANELRLYHNGLLENTANDPTGDIDSPGEALFIGAKYEENAGTGEEPNCPIAHFFRGSLDDVKIFTYALSEGEVAYLATDGGAGIHLPIISDADLYQGEAPGNQWINFKDYSLIADQYLEKLLWPTP